MDKFDKATTLCEWNKRFDSLQPIICILRATFSFVSQREHSPLNQSQQQEKKCKTMNDKQYSKPFSIAASTHPFSAEINQTETESTNDQRP